MTTLDKILFTVVLAMLAGIIGVVSWSLFRGPEHPLRRRPPLPPSDDDCEF
jgi:H+/Cl- antiporter ClcA